MRLKYFKATLASLVLSVSCLSHAGIISDYAKVDSINDDWNIVYQGGYGTSFNYADILNNIAPGSVVALASSSSASSLTYDLFAGTDLSVLQTLTGRNQTIFSDDAYWYRNSSSVGFSLGATIYQTSADAEGIFTPGDGTEDHDISWHGGESMVTGGWRSGTNTSLNSNNTWQRYVLVYDGEVEEVPEPSTLAIFALGVIGLASRRFKKQS